MLLGINKVTHQMLSEHVIMDPWESMFRESNQSVASPHGRITLHIFWELHYDFLPNFCYNSTTDRLACDLVMVVVPLSANKLHPETVTAVYVDLSYNFICSIVYCII